MAEDWADRHVARWQGHWIKVPFDDEVEAAVVRIGRLSRYLKGTVGTAAAAVGLQDFEYETLHVLMIRDTPGTATPTALAEQLGISGAGMTGRLDGMVRKGLVERAPSTEDRRRVVVKITEKGADSWRKAMALRGEAENALVGVLTRTERATLNRLLKKMTLHVENDAG